MSDEKLVFDDDLGDFDTGFDGEDAFNPAAPSGRNPVLESGRSLLSGASQEVKNPLFYKTVLKAALPSSFSVTLDTVDTAIGDSQRTYSQALQEAKPLISQVRKVAGAVNRMIPSPYQAKIERYLKSKDKRDFAAIDVDREETAVQQGIGDLFVQQAQDEKSTEQAERLLAHVDETDYRKSVLTQLNAVVRHLTLQTENQLRIQRMWQHKSLEVQLRQLFISRRTLEVTQQGMSENSMLLRDIVKNTGLPDIQKEQQSETLTRLTRERLFGVAQDKISDWAKQNRYLQAVTNRLQTAITAKVNEVQQGFRSAADMFDSVEEQLKSAKEYGINTGEMAGEMAGGTVATRAGAFLGRQVGRRLGVSRLDKTFRTLNHQMGNAAHFGTQIGRRWKQSGSRLGQWAGDILDVPFQQDRTIATGRLADLDRDPGKMNREDRKLHALEITLPGFLSRILQSSEGIRTGVLPDRLVADPQQGTLMPFKDSTSSVAHRVIDKQAVASSREELSRLVRSLGGEDLSKEDRQALHDFLKTKSKDVTWGLTPAALVGAENGLPWTLRRSLGETLSRRYGGLYQDGKWKTPTTGLSGIRSLEEDARRYNNYRDQNHDIYQKVKSVHAAGGIEQLIAAGIVKWDDLSQSYVLSSDPVVDPNDTPAPTEGIRIPPRVSPTVPQGGGAAPVADTQVTRPDMGSSKSVVAAINEQTSRMVELASTLPIREGQAEQNTHLAHILAQLVSLKTKEGRQPLGDARRPISRLTHAVKSGASALFSAPLNIARAVLSPAMALGKSLQKVSLPKWNPERFSDLYIQSEAGFKRVLSHALLTAGHYADITTGKTLKSLKDIQGAVVNRMTGELVLTQDEFLSGLFTDKGTPIKTRLSSLLTRAISWAASPLTLPFTLASRAVRAVTHRKKPIPDIYLRGKMDAPVLYGQKMENGDYYSGRTRKPIRQLKDIDGDVYTWDKDTKQARVVLTADQLRDPGITDGKGDRISVRLATLTRALGGTLSLLNPFSMVKGAGRMMAAGARTLLSPIKRLGESSSGSWPKRIYQLLWNHYNDLPLDAPITPGRGSLNARLNAVKERTGSWINRLSMDQKRKARSPDNTGDVRRQFPWLKTIMSGFGMVGLAVGALKATVNKLGGSLIKWLPKLLSALGGSKLLSTAGDVLGSVLGGKRGGLLRTTTRVLGSTGRLAGTALRSGGRLGALAIRALAPLAVRGLASIVSNPVGLVVAAVAAGAGYLIYKGYKAYQGRITPIREMRLAQYGFSKGDDSDKLGKVLALEEACMKAVKWDSNDIPTLGELAYPELIQAFDIPITAEKSVMSWSDWFAHRFRPVFLKNLQEIRRRDPKATLLEPNTSLPEGALPSYALATRLPDKTPTGEKGPYYVESSPFQNHACIIGTDLVDATIQNVVLTYAQAARKYKAAERRQANLSNAEQVNVTPHAGKQMLPGFQLQKTDRLYAAGDVKATLGTLTGDPDKDNAIMLSNLIDDVTAIRMKLYGMRELSKTQVNLIWRLEDTLLKSNAVALRNKTALFTGDTGRIVQEWAPVFGVSLGVASDVSDWRFWFERRFLPVFLNFVTRGSKWLGSDNLLNKVRTAHPEVQYSVAEFMSIAKTEVNGQSVSVWSVNAYPFPMESANTDSLVIKGNLESLRQRIKDKKYSESLVKQNPNLKYGRDGRLLTDPELMNRLASSPGSALPTNAANAAALAAQGGTSELNGGGGLTTFDTSGFQSVGDVTPNGGKASSLPSVNSQEVVAAKTPEQRFGLLRPLFEAVGKMIGVDVPTLTAFAMQESGFNPLAKAGSSSATGLFQFISSTWEGYVNKLKALGFTNPQVTDPVANTVAGAMFIRDNMTALKPVVGRMPNIPELYLAHFLGAGGAKKVLSQPDSAPVTNGVDSGQMRANAAVFKNVSTIADLKQWAARMMQKGIRFTEKQGGGSIAQPGSFTSQPTVVNASIPQQVNGITLPSGSAPLNEMTGPIGARTVSVTPTVSPVPVTRTDVTAQRQVQAENAMVKAQAVRASAETQTQRSKATTAQVKQMRKTHSVQEDIRDATQQTAALLQEIRDLVKHRPGTPITPSGNRHQQQEEMLLKNTAPSVPSGTAPGSRPFNTARQSR